MDNWIWKIGPILLYSDYWAKNLGFFSNFQYKIEKREESEDEEDEDDDDFMSTKKKDEVPDDPMARKEKTFQISYAKRNIFKSLSFEVRIGFAKFKT